MHKIEYDKQGPMIFIIFSLFIIKCNTFMYTKICQKEEKRNYSNKLLPIRIIFIFIS